MARRLVQHRLWEQLVSQSVSLEHMSPLRYRASEGDGSAYKGIPVGMSLHTQMTSFRADPSSGNGLSFVTLEML